MTERENAARTLAHGMATFRLRLGVDARHKAGHDALWLHR
jgi:hypothetical protein